MAIKLGSLFDGSGGFPLAGALFGIEPVWASEIEPYPLRVTAKRFPNMKQLGDVMKINGAEIEPVDIITFGSPCQDLSVAGKQAGIHDGQRSNLFFDAIRIIREMRNATSDKYPRFAVWENVPGAYSSNKGADFRAVLQEFVWTGWDDAYVPMPKGGRWARSGNIVGDGYSIAWRTYDAQYWGVPQRRKRIYLVADFASERAGEILFESESLSGDSESRHEAWKGITGNAEGSAGGSCGVYDSEVVYRVLDAGNGGGGQQHGICYPINLMVATRGGKDDMRTCFGIGEDGDPQFTLSAAHEHGVCYSIEGHVIDRNTGQNGKGWAEGYAHTLNATDRHGIVFCFEPGMAQRDGKDNRFVINKSPTIRANTGDNKPAVVYDARINGNGQVVPTLTGDHERAISNNMAMVCHQNLAVCIGNRQLHNMSMAPVANTLDTMHDAQAVLTEGKPPRKYIVRRLTPLECCRLQGFPDWWTEDVEGSDSAQYKMWGNGIALPCAADVIGRLAEELQKGGKE